MNPLANEWPIKHRAEACAVTQRPFAAGENFYTLLFREADGFRREDLSEEAWTTRNENIRPFSFWRSRYEPPPGDRPNRLPKKMPRNFCGDCWRNKSAEHANACYVLAVMLERKRILKQIKSETTDGDRVLIYEHAKTGDVFIVPDPQLRLDEIEKVQDEVAQPVAGERCLTNYTFDDDTRPALVYQRKFSALSRAHGRRV